MCAKVEQVCENCEEKPGILEHDCIGWACQDCAESFDSVSLEPNEDFHSDG
jgi:ribosomal protein L37AE/L43A